MNQIRQTEIVSSLDTSLRTRYDNICIKNGIYMYSCTNDLFTTENRAKQSHPLMIYSTTVLYDIM